MRNCCSHRKCPIFFVNVTAAVWMEVYRTTQFSPMPVMWRCQIQGFSVSDSWQWGWEVSEGFLVSDMLKRTQAGRRWQVKSFSHRHGLMNNDELPLFALAWAWGLERANEAELSDGGERAMGRHSARVVWIAWLEVLMKCLRSSPALE